MKKSLKLFFIITMFSVSTSFAGEREERLDLITGILKPIVDHFGPSASPAYLMRLQSLERQVEEGKQANHDSVLNIRVDTCAAPAISMTDKKLCEARAIGECKPSDTKDMSITKVAKSMLHGWREKVANCGEYARLARVVFEFNDMNREKLNEAKLFKEAVIVMTLPDTGLHATLLVENMNGMVFMVDPWIKYAKKVNKFPSLAALRQWSRIMYENPDFDTKKMYPVEDIDGKEPDPNLQLNLLYRDKKSGFYDGFYVKERTRWILDVAQSEKIQEFVHTYNPKMKEFYNTLRPSFPQWVKEYDDLFPGHTSPLIIPGEAGAVRK